MDNLCVSKYLYLLSISVFCVTFSVISVTNTNHGLLAGTGDKTAQVDMLDTTRELLGSAKPH